MSLTEMATAIQDTPDGRRLLARGMSAGVEALIITDRSLIAASSDWEHTFHDIGHQLSHPMGSHEEMRWFYVGVVGGSPHVRVNIKSSESRAGYGIMGVHPGTIVIDLESPALAPRHLVLELPEMLALPPSGAGMFLLERRHPKP